MLVYLDHTNQHVIDLIKHDHPNWAEKDGICKPCVEYYQHEINGSIFKDAPCALRIRKTTKIFNAVKNLFGVKTS